MLRLMLPNPVFLVYSQTCVQRRQPWDPEKVAVVDKWSLFSGHLCNKSSKGDLKRVAPGLTVLLTQNFTFFIEYLYFFSRFSSNAILNHFSSTQPLSILVIPRMVL